MSNVRKATVGQKHVRAESKKGKLIPSPVLCQKPVANNIYVVVNFLFQLIFIFPLFLGMVMYAKQFKTKEKQNLTEIKN